MMELASRLELRQELEAIGRSSVDPEPFLELGRVGALAAAAGRALGVGGTGRAP